MNAAAVAVALSAAVAFGGSTALMYHSASRAPQNDGGAGGTIALVRHLIVQPRWIFGMVASLAGLALHTLALRLGSLAVVQPLVVTGLVFAFVFRALLDRQHPPRALTGWVLLTAFGIVLFLTGARSVNSSSSPNGRATAFFLIIGVLIVAVTWRSSSGVGSRFGRNHAGVLLGVSGGIVFGLIAGVLKTVTGTHGLVSLFTSWPVYALVLLGACGFLINQHAYSTAPLASSLPVLDVVNPVVAVLFGMAAFHERPSGDPLTVTVAGIGLVIVLAGVFFLARVDDHHPTVPRPDPAVPGSDPAVLRPDPHLGLPRPDPAAGVTVGDGSASAGVPGDSASAGTAVGSDVSAGTAVGGDAEGLPGHGGVAHDSADGSPSTSQLPGPMTTQRGPIAKPPPTSTRNSY